MTASRILEPSSGCAISRPRNCRVTFTKVRHLREFLDDGHKVKVTLQFRGREMAHPELGSKILDAVIEELGSAAKVEAYARLEGRNMTMVLAPEKKIVKKEPKPARAHDDDAPAPTSEIAAEADATAATDTEHPEHQEHPDEPATDITPVAVTPAGPAPAEPAPADITDPA